MAGGVAALTEQRPPFTLYGVNGRIINTQGQPASQQTAFYVAMGAVLLLVMVGLAYAPVFQAGFVWDDDDYLTQNANMTAPDGLQRIWFVPQSSPQYYPMVFSSFWLEYQWWGDHPLGYHVNNVILHWVNALLLWAILARFRIPGAWLAACLFAVHPIQVESVAWIAERKNVLSAFFYLLATWIYCRPLPGTRLGAGRYALCLLLFVAALLSKSVTATWPLVMLIMVWWRTGRLKMADAVRMIPFVIIAGIASLHTVMLEQHHVGAMGSAWDLSVFQRCVLVGRTGWFYVGKILLPWQQVFIYPRWDPATFSLVDLIYPLALLITLPGLWFMRKRWGRGPLAAASFYFVTLLPASGLFNVYPMRYSFVADHFVYLASLGILVPVAAWLWRCCCLRSLGGRILVAVLIIFLCQRSFSRARIFEDQETLWEITAQQNPGAWIAWNNLGGIYRLQGDEKKAIVMFRRSLELNPANAEAWVNLGDGLHNAEQFDSALDSYHRAQEQGLLVEPFRWASAQLGAGRNRINAGDFESARSLLIEARKNNPDDARIHYALGLVAANDDNDIEAVTNFRKAVEGKPVLLPALNNLAWLLVTSTNETVRNVEQGLQYARQLNEYTQYQNTEALTTLARAWRESGNTAKAAEMLERAIDLEEMQNRQQRVAELRDRLDRLEQESSND